MRLLALAGSLALFVYVVVGVWLTSVNISRFVFSEHEDTTELFWVRQFTIFLWPLMLISEEGRKALAIFWSKETEE